MAALMGFPDFLSAAEPPFKLPAQADLNKLDSATIFTSKGRLHFRLFPHEAPWHVANFKYRADKGLYKNTAFHIHHQDYIIQGGGPVSSPASSAAYGLPAEFNEHKHIYGALGMARRADMANPERSSSGNQFHILLGENSRMNGAFTVFGELLGDGAVLDSLKAGDRIEDIKVYVNP